MLLAGVLIDEITDKGFKDLGIKDSKQILPNKREQLAEIIKDRSIDYEIVLTTADQIDQNLNSGTNLNSVEAIKTAKIINKIIERNLDKKINIVVDCPSTNTKAWQDEVISLLTTTDNLEISCEHKADVNHVSVAAASILAKTTRDAEIEKLKKKIGKNFGSGYASDPTTIEFLQKQGSNHLNDGLIRTTWQTWKKQAAKKNQKGLSEY
ncbi:MAG: ribonuclease HII [Nanoarchaeota archaeon]|nr:ribonuclease HII [Nanoarchaeota archaeon]